MVEANSGVKLYEDVDGDGRLSVVEYLENTGPFEKRLFKSGS